MEKSTRRAKKTSSTQINTQMDVVELQNVKVVSGALAFGLSKNVYRGTNADETSTKTEQPLDEEDKVEKTTKKRVKKTSMEQFNMLVEEMQRNPKLARGSLAFGLSKDGFAKQWSAIAKKLNACGPTHRSVLNWKKIWADLKSRTKRKVYGKKRSPNVNANGDPFHFNPLTEIEQAVAATLLLPKSEAPPSDKKPYTSPEQSPTTTANQEVEFDLIDEEPSLEEIQEQSTFATAHAEAAKVLAEAAKAQVQATKIIAEAMTIQAEATKQIVDAIEKLVKILNK